MKKPLEQKEKRLGSEENLPATRWQLMGDTLRFNFWDLCAISLLAFLFWIPSFGWLIFCSLSNLLDFANLGSVLMVYGINAILIALAGIGMAGSFYFSHKLSFALGVSLPSDFFEGIRKNGIMFFVVYLFIGLLYAFLRIDLCALVNGGYFSGWGLIALEGVSYAVFFVFLLALHFVQTETILYQGGFFQLFANAVRFIFGAFLTNVPIFLAYFALFLVFEFVSYYQVSFAMMGLSGIFYFGFSSFFFSNYSNYLFDKSINKKQYPDLIRKGLRQSESADRGDKVDL